MKTCKTLFTSVAITLAVLAVSISSASAQTAPQPAAKNGGIGVSIQVTNTKMQAITAAMPKDSTQEDLRGAIQKYMEEIYRTKGLDAATQAMKDLLEPKVSNDQPLVIQQVMPGSPASTAGLLANDRLNKVNLLPINGKTVQQVSAALRGPIGQPVVVTVERTAADGKVEEKSFTIMRAKISTDPAVSNPNAPKSNVVLVDSSNYQQEVVNQTIPVFIEFYAPWCGPCKTQAPIVEAAEQRFAGKVHFVKINIDDSPELAQGIPAIPAMRIIAKPCGKVTEKIGLLDAASLEKFINSALQACNAPSSGAPAK